MSRLDSSERARLPDSAFAYVDSKGRRRLPINDEAHVRNALSRFTRVRFESEAARERARKRLLKAARKYGIVPIGFITGQLDAERKAARSKAVKELSGDDASPPIDTRNLPTGFVTLLMTDIESSTALLRRLGDRYSDLLRDVRDILGDCVTRAGGHVVDARADDFFAVFGDAKAAMEAAAEGQRALAGREWPDDLRVRVRAGLHSGEPTLTDVGYIGIPVHVTARVCAAANGGQIILTGETRTALGNVLAESMTLRELGLHALHGIAEPARLFQLEAEGLPSSFPAVRTAGAIRS